MLIASKLRALLLASRLRSSLIGGGILLLVAAVPVGLLISSPSWLWSGDQAKDAKVPVYRAVPDFRDCAGVEGINYGDTVCYDVVTQAQDSESLARPGPVLAVSSATP